jgi:patatin-like phospholipase/acyl hydrolase
MEDNKFKILSLDGGGVRGYLTAKILENVESYLNRVNDENINIGQRFDLIAGTSTGAIIAGLLAIGKSAKEVREFYDDYTVEIFGKKRNWLQQLYKPKYDNSFLEMKAKELFGEKSLKDVETDILITSVALSTAKARFHKSGYFDRNGERLDEKLSDIVLASTSAPTYFKAKEKLEHSSNLIDGGIVANNPSLVALIDAFQFKDESLRKHKKPEKFEDVTLLSIGTGEICCVPYKYEKLKHGGLFNWAKPISDIVLEAQSQLASYQTGFVLKNGNYLRINPKLKMEMKLDDVSQIDELKNIADLEYTHEQFLKQKF